MKSKFSRTTLILSLFSLIFLTAGVVTAGKYSSKTPWIGVHMQSIDEDLREAFDLDDVEGVLITDVADDSPAEDAGLRRKDIIIKFGGKKVSEPDFLRDMVEDTEIGDEVEIVYTRRGKEKTTTVEIGRRPKSDSRTLIFEPGYSTPKNLLRRFSFSAEDDAYIGVAVKDLGEQLGDYFGVEDGEGVLVTEVFEDSPAEEAGLKAGDVIISADGEDVAETSDLTDVIDDKEEGDKVEIVYLRRGNKAKVTVEVAEDATGLNAFTLPHFNQGHIQLPKFKSYDHFLFDDDYFKDDDYREDMKSLKQEMKKLQKELGEIRKKLE